MLGLLLFVIQMYCTNTVDAAQFNSMVLICDVPGPNYEWQKYMSQQWLWVTLNNSAKYDNADTSQLTIRNVDVTDNGFYCCLIDGQVIEQMYVIVTASKQMVYEVYMNVIGTLEEFEGRLSNKVPKDMKSVVPKPEFATKSDADIRGQVASQLILFQHQLECCNRDIFPDTLGELKHTTLNWVSCREELGIAIDGEVDKFVGQLYEILAIGTTEHPKEFDQRPGDVPNVPIETFQAVLSGQHDARELDRQFREQPDKQASLPGIRSGTDIAQGAKRLRKIKPDLANHLPSYKPDGVR